MDIKKAPYTIAFEQRQKQTEEDIKSEHKGTEPSRDSQLEIKPQAGSIQLGEGSHR